MATWFWISILVLFCAVIGGYVYLVEYRGDGGGSIEPALADHDEGAAGAEGHTE